MMTYKENLLNAISQIDNEELLHEIGRLIAVTIGDDQIVELTSTQRAEIQSAIDEIEQGESLTHDESKNQARGWLKE